MSELSYQVRKTLADSLEISNFDSLKRLLAQCSDVIGSINQNEILCNLSSCQVFFEDLAYWKPQVTLADVKDCIENRRVQNKAIFKDVEVVINSKEVTFTLESTLYQLKENGEHWLYFLDHIANKLVERERHVLPTWKDVADFFGYSQQQIDTFEALSKSDDRPTFKLLRLLNQRRPDLDVDYLKERLKNIRRNDIITDCNWD